MMMSNFFSSSKKAQGLSINMVIMVVLGLIVLIVVIAVVTGKFRLFGKESVSCASRGGAGPDGGCYDVCPSGSVANRGTDCSQRTDNKKICCVPFEYEPPREQASSSTPRTVGGEAE